MAARNPNYHADQQIMDAIANAEQLLMFDETHDDHHHHPFIDNFVNDMLQDPNDSVAGINYGTQFSGIRSDENTNNENSNFTGFPQIPPFGNPIRIPIWPVPPSPYSCTCCQTLREFYHTNGSQVLKLDVHGRLGLISHAVLDRYDSNYPSSENHHEYNMFDFSQESISNVKQFLIQYCDDRKREGYVMLQDPLSNFYNALCIGLDGDHIQTSGGERHMNQSEEDGNRVNKSYLASQQRERTGNMKLRDVARYFHLPINVASKEMKICSSALKSICRKEGLSRWPYRKINSIKKMISKKKRGLNSSDAIERARAAAEIEQLQLELAKFYGENVD
ncbi:hypothetical protein CASFOL_000148 [Castilleja foliolosa]|uniref:RWP-RK domain-containing protein n=1 Tax=Castilleja foliolosa TaxID=1961234 RepID=A0ABD3END6_9LAMI